MVVLHDLKEEQTENMYEILQCSDRNINNSSVSCIKSRLKCTRCPKYEFR